MNALRRLRRRLHWVALLGVLGLIGSLIYANSTSDTYAATARLFVGTSAKDVTQANQGTQAGQSRLVTYATIATGPELLNRAARRSRMNISGEELAGKLAVAPLPGTVLLDLTVTDSDEVVAANIAEAVAQELIAVVADIEKPIGGGSPSLGLIELAPASSGIAKVSKFDPITLGAGLLAGLALGVLIALVVPGRRIGSGAQVSPPNARRSRHSQFDPTTPPDSGT